VDVEWENYGDTSILQCPPTSISGHLHDVSGIKNVTIQYHEDKDGINPISDTNNEVYQSDLENVGPWISMAMVHRTFPKGNIYNASIDLTCNSSGQVCIPSIIADEYWVKVIENTVVWHVVNKSHCIR
jgi:hypothetical protein